MSVQIKISDISRTYTDVHGRSTEALYRINLDISEGDFISFIGPSGCGKTTLLRLIAGLDLPQEGSLYIDDKRITAPDYERGFVFQQAALYPWKTVEENIAIGLKARKIYKENKDLVSEYINLIGLSGFAKAYPHEISGGMAQRVAIARALINKPKVLLMDEPLGALDAFTRIDLQDLLYDVWKKTNTTIVLVTHDVDEAIRLSNRIVVMTARPGKISETIKVDLNDVRDRNDDKFILLRKRVLKEFHLAGSQPSKLVDVVASSQINGAGEAI
jgi:sulfonate transport system ATP-binding protein